MMRTKNNDKDSRYYYAQTNPDGASDSEVYVQFQVQKILGHRLKQKYKSNYLFDGDLANNRDLNDVPNQQLQFYVKWKGYGSDFQTWEPGENFQNAPNVVEQYKCKISNTMLSSKTNGPPRPRGRRPKAKEPQKDTQKKPERQTRGLKFGKIYEDKQKAVKKDEQDSDELCIIDQAAFNESTIKSKRKKITITSGQPNQQNEQAINAPSQEIPKALKPQIQAKPNEDEAEQGIPPPLPFIQQPPKEIINNEPKIGMPQNYCQLGSNLLQEPSQSLSSFLNHPHQQENGEKEKSKIENKPDKTNQILANSNANGIPASEYSLTAQNLIQKRIRLNLASIFDGLDSAEQQRQFQILKKLEEQLRLEKKQKRNAQLESQKDQRSDFKPSEFQQNRPIQTTNHQANQKKRQKTFQYAPEETGQKIVKKVKSSIEVEADQDSNIDNNQRSVLPYHNKKDDKKVNFELLLRQKGEMFQKPIQINIQTPVKQLLHKKTLNERIDREIRSLYQTQPINLLDQQDHKSQDRYISKYSQIKNKKPANCRLQKEWCTQCSKTKLSYGLLVDYIKYHIQEMNDQNCALSLERIYEEQQTYILINGLNPNIDLQKSDKIKKLVMLENQGYLENLIVRKAAKQEELIELVELYRLGKIVWIKGEWYGIFKIQKLMHEKNHYRYAKIKDLVKSFKQKIYSYLIEKE